MAAQKPDWLNAELFELVLKENEPLFSKITKFESRLATAPGENYATQVWRVEVTAALQDDKEKLYSYIMKVPIGNPQFQALMKQMRTFEKEQGVYLEVMPELEELYRNAGVDLRFGPKSYKLATPNDVDNLVLEDLCVRGFKNVNRQHGLDLEHTKWVLKKLAQWHAASAVRVESRGKYSSLYAIGNFVEAIKPIMEAMITSTGATLRKCMRSFAGYETWKDSVEKLRPHMVDEMFKAGKADPTEFNVLNHGDCWSNNIMFQYDAFGKIKDVYLVDYQIPKYGSPAQDLYYFLLSSTKFEIKIKQFDQFIRIYHENLVENLTLLQYAKPIPKLKDIHMAMYKYGIWGYSTVTGVMAAVLVDPDENANFDNFVGDSPAGNAFKMLMFSNPTYRKHIEALLPWLQDRGALEY